MLDAGQRDHHSKSVLVLTNIPNHYRIPLFNELMHQLNGMDADLKVVFAAESYQRRSRSGRETKLGDAEFEWEILPSVVIGRNRPLFIPLGLTNVVEALRPAAIVVAGTGTLAVAVSQVARRRSIPWLVWSGEVNGRSGLLVRFKRRLKKHLLGRAAAVITYGTAAADFARTLSPGVETYHAWNTVDLNVFLAVSVDQRRDRTTDTIRVVGVGDLVPYKGHRRLLEALALIDQSYRDRLEVAIVGEGPLRAELTALAEHLGLERHFHLLGAVPASEVPKVLAESHVFVFPSLGEPWGLALVEGMAAGLPVIASSSAGATRDLVVPGTGIVVDPTNVEELANALEQMLRLSPAERHEMGMRAKAHVSELCSLENSAAGFVEAIRQSLTAAPR
jgi:glycosyltransferase involved in cell wall biosynthesis